ncbi:MAG: cysteine--tRNA ligase [Bacilli bacterium]|nr:cysteine--tRNA ligase [Bacilli bacterium]
MTLKIYNTLTRQKETFHSIEPGKVKMYVCGPTVYDYIHIGNARPLIFFDLVRRYLTASGYEVNYIVNITDVEDKMIRKAEQLGTDVPAIADQFIAAFLEDSRALGIQETTHPRVTDNIAEIIAFIEGLIAKDYAYESGGDVYFYTDKFTEYGKLSKQNLEELQFGIRVEIDERKRNPHDFVLWKKAKAGEIHWSSPWGEGRPGWHIECSAMVRKYLGDTIDIHGGGQDLQFPHHECEVAQSESLTGQPMAHYWMHNGYININNEKMSKSLGNGFNVREMLNKVGSEVIRFFMLSAHYRNPLNYSDDVVQQAKNSLERLNNCLANVKHRLQITNEQAGSASDEVVQTISAIGDRFKQKMDDDFNTADAVTAMFDLANEANRYLQQERVEQRILKLILEQFASMNEILGILQETQSELLDEEIESLIEQRIEARTTKNWAKADEIRNLLIDKGIILEDTSQGIRWRRK